MKRSLIVLALAAVIALPAAASPAFAATGREYGTHHSTHAIEEGGFTAEHNPGVKHQGYAGWMAE